MASEEGLSGGFGRAMVACGKLGGLTLINDASCLGWALTITCRKQSQELQEEVGFSRFQPLLHVAEALAPDMCIAFSIAHRIQHRAPHGRRTL